VRYRGLTSKAGKRTLFLNYLAPLVVEDGKMSKEIQPEQVEDEKNFR
jgi:hypothetical protein